MYHNQNTGHIHNLIINHNFFENIEKLKYLGTIKIKSLSLSLFGNNVMNQNCIQEEIKSRLNSGNICYHSVQNLLFSHFLSKNIKITIQKSIIPPVILYRHETWSHIKGRTQDI
jgi:hypothetical protein